MIKSVTYVLPSYLAPALVNGDFSSLDANEKDYLNDWLDEKKEEHGGVFHCIHCEDYGYCREHDYDNIAADCQKYTFHVNEE